MCRNKFSFLMGMALLFSACDGSAPVDVQDPVEEVELQEMAVAAFEAAEQDGTPLPSLEGLLRQTYRTIREDPEAHSEGITFLKRARLQARRAKEARDAGDEEGAKAHLARSQALTLEAILSVLGDEIAARALAGVDLALERLETRLSGKAIPDRYRKALDRVALLSGRGHLALESGNPRGALQAALNAAELLRAIVPRYQAERSVFRANRAYSAAMDLVANNDPTREEKEALQKARSLLAEAKAAFRDRDYRTAILFARESASLSLGVLAGRSGG